MNKIKMDYEGNKIELGSDNGIYFNNEFISSCQLKILADLINDKKLLVDLPSGTIVNKVIVK